MDGAVAEPQVRECPEGHILSPEIIHHDCVHGLNVFMTDGLPVFVAFEEDERRSLPRDKFAAYIYAQQKALRAMDDALLRKGIKP
ncbi:hypothetical protein [Williamsia sp.]|uniref:hypothetical protein n=1 Tax=Williamsia sp. TaxID=1872085 RepID=UPI002F93E75A